MKSEERWEGGLFGESQETCHFYVDEAKASGIGLSGKFMSRMMKRLLMVGMLHVCITAVLQAQDVAKEATLQEVVVTGTGTQHLLKNAPVQTEVITHQMLRQYGAHSLQDILGALSSSFAFNEGDMGSQIQMNGLGNAYILILIDGKRLHGDNGGDNDLSLIDPHNIEKIEIVKGASSALYGSDAIAGVINIITRKHDNDAFLFENTTRYERYHGLQQHNGLALSYGKWKSYTNFQLKYSDGWQNTSTEDPHQTEYLITDSKNMTVNKNTSWQVAERLTYEPAKGLELYAEGSIYWKRIYRPQDGTHAGVDKKTFDMRYNNASAAVGGKWRLNKEDLVTLDVDWNRHAYTYDYTAMTLTDGYVDGYFTHYFPYFAGQSQLQSDQRRLMAHLKGVFSLPKGNRLSVGAEYRYDWLEAQQRVEGGRATDNTEALYAQDEWRYVCNDLVATHFTAGLRLTRNEGFGLYLTPKLSAMVSIGDLNLRATWSQGFKSPTPKELHYRYVRDMNGTYLFLGNTDLKPQTSDYFSLGAEYTRGGLTVSVTPYYNKVNKMITLVTIPNAEAPLDLYTQYQPIKTRQYKNLESAKTWGCDVNVRYRIGTAWTAGLGYSYLDTDAEIYDTEKDQLQKVVIDGMAHHKGTCFVMWNHAFPSRYRLGIGLYGRFSTKRYYQLNGDGKGYQLWRISTTHDLPIPKSSLFRALSLTALRVEAGIDNIFDYVDRTYHGLHLGTTTPGRSFYASLTLNFNQGKKLSNNFKSNFKKQNNEED